MDDDDLCELPLEAVPMNYYKNTLLVPQYGRYHMDYTSPQEATPTSYTKTLVKTKLLYMYFVHDVGLKGHVLFFYYYFYSVPG